MNAVSIGLILGAFTVAGCSADDSLAPERLTSVMRQSPAIESDVASACSTSPEPVNSLHVEAGGGEALSLAYFVGCGWKYTAANRTARAKMGLERIANGAASVHASAVLDRENPMTVYIDGPTGYVFGWTPTAGWKFVGQLQP